MKYNTNSPRSVLPNSNRDIVYLTNGIDKNENYRYFSNYSLKQSKNNNKNIEFGKIYKVKSQHSGQSLNTNLLNTKFPKFNMFDSIHNHSIFRLQFVYTDTSEPYYINVVPEPQQPIQYVVYFKTRNSAERFHKHMLETDSNYMYPEQGRIRKIPT
jgi:hypothetical protein